MYKTFLQIWIFILCINGMLVVVNALVEDSNEANTNPEAIEMSVGTPFNIAVDLSPCADPTDEICLQQYQLATNSTTMQNFNATSTSNNPLDAFATFGYASEAVWDFVGMLTGSTVFNALAMFGFTPVFVYVCQGIMGVFMAITIVHYVFNR